MHHGLSSAFLAITTGSKLPPVCKSKKEKPRSSQTFRALKQSHPWKFSLVCRGSKAQGAAEGPLASPT